MSSSIVSIKPEVYLLFMKQRAKYNIWT